MEFPTLYQMDKTQKCRQWTISVEESTTHSTVRCHFGRTPGKMIESSIIIDKGKNIGKKNETSHYEQALSEASSRWRKKKEIEGYQEFFNLGSRDDDKPSLPMLAHDFRKHEKKIRFPCHIQPKLDGYRMIYNPQTKKCSSRTGKEYSILYQTELYKELQTCPFELDGELYRHDPDFAFESLGILRKISTNADVDTLNKIQYHVYDIIDSTLSFKDRWSAIEKWFRSHKIKFIVKVPTMICNTKDDFLTKHREFVRDGYEGSMLRNSDGLYKRKERSYDLQKHKDFQDAEYIISGFTGEKNTDGGDPLIIWICDTNDGKSFKVVSKGTDKDRQSIYKQAGKYIGQKLSVQFIGFTNDGIPRFPKTLRDGLESIRYEE
jgi:DNA ligase 1